MYILHLLFFAVSALAVQLKLSPSGTMFDGQYLWNNRTLRYERTAEDSSTGFTEYVERSSDGKWHMGSLSNHLEKGAVHVTVATAEHLEDSWDMVQIPRPNDQWVVTLDGDVLDILAKLQQYIQQNDDLHALKDLHRAAQTDSAWAVHMAVATAFMKANHGTLAPCVGSELCFYANSELFGEFQSLLAFSFSDSSAVARKIRDTLLDIGILKNVEADVLGTSSASWADDFTAADSPSHAYTGEGVYVFVVDSGIRSSHEEFGGRVLLEYSRNYLEEGDLQYVGNHGTHCASIVGGVGVGVASEVNIISSKVMGRDMLIHGHTLLKAINDIISVQIPKIRGVDPDAGIVLSMSLSFDVRWMPVEGAIETLYEHRAITVVAAGNSGQNVCTHAVSPQAAQFAVSVANLDRVSTPTLAATSNYGRCENATATIHNSWCKFTLPWKYATYEEAVRRCYDYGASNQPCTGVYNRLCRDEMEQDEFELCQSEPIRSSIGSCVHKVPLSRGIDVYAPGQRILGASSSSDNALLVLSGTSMSAPRVAGFVALLMEEAKNATDVDYILHTRLLMDSCREDRTVIRVGGLEESDDICVLSSRALPASTSAPSPASKAIAALQAPAPRRRVGRNVALLLLALVPILCLSGAVLIYTTDQITEDVGQSNSLHYYYKEAHNIKSHAASTS